MTTQVSRKSVFRAVLAVIISAPSFAFAQLTFTRLGGAVAWPANISNDGVYISGVSYASSRTVRWSQSTGAVPLFPAGNLGGMSADGQTIVAAVSSLFYKWTSSGGLSLLNNEYNRNNRILGLSGDGQIAVGSINNVAARWIGGTPELLGIFPGGRESEAFDISEDGKTIVGYSGTSNPQVAHAFKWTESTGMVDLGLLGGFNSLATNVSADGTYIVGYGVPLPGKSGLNAFIYNQSTGYKTISAPGLSLDAEAVSNDGSLVIGNYYAQGASPPDGFIWTPGSGVRDFASVLRDDYGFGSDVNDWSFLFPIEMSSDGRFMIGTGLRGGVEEGWLLDRGLNPPELNAANIPPGFAPVPEPALYAVTAAVFLLGTISAKFRRRRAILSHAL